MAKLLYELLQERLHSGILLNFDSVAEDDELVGKISKSELDHGRVLASFGLDGSYPIGYT